MSSVRSVNSNQLVNKAAHELKGSISKPEWASYVKTGVNRERPPENEDWWYVRAASILRRLSLDGPVGVQKLRSYYGGLHRRGHKPAHFAKGSGKVLRVILQDLEKAGFVKKEKKGRALTPSGQKLLSKVAKQVGRNE